jgi:hypothetical protein
MDGGKFYLPVNQSGNADVGPHENQLGPYPLLLKMAVLYRSDNRESSEAGRGIRDSDRVGSHSSNWKAEKA